MIEFLRCDPEPHEARGNLFGLWTTDGEPVVHIISRQRGLCTERDSNLAGISAKDCPLSHIGNWRYSDYLALLRTPASSQVVYPKCLHERERFVDLRIIKTTQQVTLSASLSSSPNYSSLAQMRCETGNLVFLPAESPFKNVKRMKEIAINSQLDECFVAAEQMDWSPSQVSEGSPLNSQKHQRHTLTGKPLSREDVEMEEIPTSTGEKQSRALFLTSNQRSQSDFSSNRDFKVFMFKEDYQMMENLVLEYPNLETGGDLFGLWTTDGDAVLHVVLGPGRNCKRTGASFYQDIPYLKRNGELLTQDYMLCHIGEWHSHHQLRLFQPSHGDSSTVIRNYPRGTHGFLLIIANIVSPNKVKLSTYLYTEKSTYSFDKMGNIVVLPNKNAFNSINNIKDGKALGKEVKAHSQYSQGGFSRFRQSPPSPAREVRATLARSPRAQKRNSGMLYRTYSWPVGRS